MNKSVKQKITYRVKGMDCEACAMLIEGELEDIGVKAKCNFARQTLEIDDDGKIKEDNLRKLVKALGYELMQ